MELEESDIYSRDYDERNCYKVMQFFHRTKTTSVGDSVYPGSGLAGGGTTDRKRTEVAAEPSPTYSSIPLRHSAVLYCLKKQSCICSGGIDLTNM